MKLSFLLLFTALTISNIKGQNLRENNWCATDEKVQELKKKDPSIIQKEEDFRTAARAYIDNNSLSENSQNNKTSPYIIPVVFHCITDINGEGYVSKADIDNALLTLNEDFSRTNSDASSTRSPFVSVAGGMNIEFRLAHLDPNNKCTQGIVRMESSLSTNAGDAVKSLSQWDEHKYFNIWVVNSISSSQNTEGRILGYAYKAAYGLNNVYGVIIRHDEVKRNSRTLTHEVGHCFNLDHTFDGSGCGGNCATSGDRICDTPPSTEATYGCATSQNTCSNDASGPSAFSTNVVDQIENYMSYDQCQNMFSKEQISFMRQTLDNTSYNFGLNQLNTNNNRVVTGVADPYLDPICVPIAEFEYNKRYICQGESVTFFDESYDATPTVYDWQFTGGSPNESGMENPSIVYNTAGVYSVTHRPGTTAGSSSATKSNIITVSSLAADYSGTVVDGFENSTDFSNEWWIENLDGGSQTFSRTTSAAATGDASVRIFNAFITNTGERHDLISPSYDLSVLNSPTISFKRAFARRDATNTDRLLVWYSLDCGESWVLAMPPLSGSSLSTIGNTLQSGNWIPAANDWEIKSRSLDNLTNETNVRFKFSFESGLGNNLYLDDINIDGTLSVEEQFKNVLGFNVFPNPTEASAKISFKLIESVQNLSIRVRNSVGQVVTNVINGQSFAVGKYTLQVDEDKSLSSGLYFIEFIADEKVQVQKLIVK